MQVGPTMALTLMRERAIATTADIILQAFISMGAVAVAEAEEVRHLPRAIRAHPLQTLAERGVPGSFMEVFVQKRHKLVPTVRAIPPTHIPHSTHQHFLQDTAAPAIPLLILVAPRQQARSPVVAPVLKRPHLQILLATALHVPRLTHAE